MAQGVKSVLLSIMGLSSPLLYSDYTRFQYQLDGTPVNYNVKWVFLDLFDTSAQTIQKIKNQGKIVICYMSAGTYENWRSDAGRFPASVRGNAVEGWNGERWLNTRDTKVLAVMKLRLDLAKKKGCTGVDPDNVDGYDNSTGFSLSRQDSINYLKKLSTEARARGLFIGLKNSSEIASSVSSFLSWAVVEQCFEYNECSSYKNFTKNGKKVFIIEYQNPSRSLCNKADSLGMNLAFFEENLNGWIRVCH